MSKRPIRGTLLSRQEFLKLTGAGLAGAALLGATGCGSSESASGGVEVNFSMGPDQSGSLGRLVKRFNEKHKGEIYINYREMPANTSAYFDQLRTELQSGRSEIDLIGGDVIWPAQFATAGWIADLSERFPDSEQKKFLDGPIKANTYDGKVWGVPWYTDAGMLYYRKDLLEKHGLRGPQTWNELKQQAKRVKQEEGLKYGFVFQGAQEEAGVVDGLEYIYSHGGKIISDQDPSRVVINSPESVAGLTTERSMVEDGVSPQAVSTYAEEQAQAAFLNGDAVFCRNWPYMYALATSPETSKIKQEQIGVGPLPAGEGGRSASGLGGWNFFLNASSPSEVQDAAFAFVEFATAPEQQKARALEASFLPTRKSLYEDREILDAVPVIALGREALKRTVPRPVSPYYSDMSLEMAEQFNASLKGEVTPEQAVQTLQKQLQDIAGQKA